MRNLFELLSKEELDMILYSIKTYSNGKAELIDNIDLKKVLKVWNNEKDFLYKLLGNQLIISKPIIFTKNELILKEEIYELMGHPFIRNFKNAVGNYNIWSLVSLTSLTENIYPGQNFIISDKGKSIKINQGCKTVRALGKIAKLLNIDGYEDFRLKHSLILNQKTIKGMLHLSIHPLDFITMSDNNCDWDSCMSWVDNGSYRRGTVEMMNSSCVLVAYISAKQPYIIDNKQWNNKKWRELFIITKDIISNVRGYPYTNDELDSIIIDWIQELAKNNLNLDFENGKHQIYSGINIKDFNEKFKISYYTEAMYNDCYKQTVCFSNEFLKREEKEPFNLYICYSGLSTCMICGKEGCFLNEEEIVCEDCSENIVCSCCGDIICNDDGIEFNNHLLCRWCYSEQVHECSKCGDKVFEDDLIELNLAIDDKLYLNIYGYICERCFKQLLDKNKIKIHKTKFISYKYLNVSDLTHRELRSIFGMDEQRIEEFKQSKIKVDSWNIINLI